MYLLYKVCGGAFTPDAAKTSKSDLIASGEATCKTMAEDDSTKGNVYLVKEGKCVQSFNGADFKAEVTEQ
jgi:hypothetical protein